MSAAVAAASSIITPALAFRVGCFLCSTSVVIGAWGNHGLPARLQGSTAAPLTAYHLKSWSTAVRYQMTNSAALMIISLAMSSSDFAKRIGRVSPFGVGLYMFGILLFCGTIYATVLMSSINSRKNKNAKKSDSDQDEVESPTTAPATAPAAKVKLPVGGVAAMEASSVELAPTSNSIVNSIRGVLRFGTPVGGMSMAFGLMIVMLGTVF
ncbi:hypothetical protein GQ42DRAFT_52879 [Ramicandelaber brevisporus]|nr:hypothetical protein GQ42DRAFT_52879 [Ramicandelaber brevisporus]